MRRCGSVIGFACAFALLLPASAAAQASISGMVQDASGAVMPGVTVEVSSPALIEKARAAVDRRRRPLSASSIYVPAPTTVTFTLPGFSTVKREGIVLQGNFDAQVNADLRVGRLEETITVSGASPVVDVTEHPDTDGADQRADRGAAGLTHAQRARRAGPWRGHPRRQHRRGRARVRIRPGQPHDGRRLQVGPAPRRPRHRPARRRQRHADAGSGDRGAGLRRPTRRAPSTRSAASE